MIENGACTVVEDAFLKLEGQIENCTSVADTLAGYGKSILIM